MIASDGQFKVWLETDQNTMGVRLHVGELVAPGETKRLSSSGSWISVPLGTVPLDTPLGIVLPEALVPLLAQAAAALAGDSLPSAGEVRVLREWLRSEQARVDLIVAKGLA